VFHRSIGPRPSEDRAGALRRAQRITLFQRSVTWSRTLFAAAQSHCRILPMSPGPIGILSLSESGMPTFVLTGVTKNSSQPSLWILSLSM